MEKISGCNIKELAAGYGTPLYVYDKVQFEENYKKLSSAFDEYYPHNMMHYSVKANSNLRVLETFAKMGAGADCSSPIELFLARKAGFEDNKILYTGNYESPDDIEALKNSNICINLDDINSFKRLIKVFRPEKISFRINPGIGKGGYEGITTAGADAKFGVPYEKAAEAYKMALDAGIERFGIHMMAGSNNLEPYYFAEVVEKLFRIAGTIFPKLGIKPEYIDIGGGFGVPYHDDEDELDVNLTAKLLADVFKERCAKYELGTPELKTEPGRYLAANAGYLVAKVTSIKESYKDFAGVDAGMNTLLRPALYGAYHRVEVYGKENKSKFYNLCGQICENSDIFASHVYLPQLEEGDLLIFRDAGAYGYVMASNYNNRLRPAEVMVDAGKHQIIRRRERIEDIMRMYE
ncbi:MAG: diaminopimelate decarboxylase, partial [Bacteroidota bacterium]